MWIVATVAAAALLGISDSDDKIVGGKIEKSILNRPYMAELSWNNDHVCTGGIIQPKWILTACHCLGKFSFFGIEPPSSTAMLGYRVVAGSVLRFPGERTAQIRRVQTFLAHPKCINLASGNRSKSVYDIGAVEVTEKFKFNAFVKPMRFYEIDPVIYENRIATLIKNPELTCTLSGWGGESKDMIISHHMKTLDVKFLSEKDCLSGYIKTGNDYYGYFNFSFSEWKQYCVESVRGIREGPHVGDSGAPLICNGYVVGVHSTAGYNGFIILPIIIQSVSVMMDLFEQRNILCDEPNGCRLLDFTTAKTETSAKEELPSHSFGPSDDSISLLARTNSIYVLISSIVAVSL